MFSSGANQPGEIRGFTSLGIPIGVSVPELGPQARAELTALRGTGIPVFVDHGGCAEVSADPSRQARSGIQPAPGVLLVVHEITEEGWDGRLEVQEDLAVALRDQAYIVAPDRVGDQRVTLQRLTRYAPRVRDMAAAGARIVLPLQRGATPLLAFHRTASTVLGLDAIPAFPLARGGVRPIDVLQFVEVARPRAVHLLGVGPRGRGTAPLLRALAATAPDLRVSMDANFTAALVGRSGNAPRALTRAQDAVRAAGYEQVCGTVVNHAWGIHEDYTEQISRPSGWLGPTRLLEVATRAGLPSPLARRFARDPELFLQAPIRHNAGALDFGDDGGPRWWEAPSLAAALDEAYLTHLDRRHANLRKAAAITAVFHDHPAAGQFPPPDSGHPERVAHILRSRARPQSAPRARPATRLGQTELPL